MKTLGATGDRLPAWHLVVPLLAAVAAYLPALGSGLVWDDPLVAQQILALRSWRDVLLPPAGISEWSYYYYRPVVVASYVVDRMVFGPGATLGPHLVNVAWHLVTTTLVWLIAARLVPASGERAAAALLAATVFAVHPIHTESVTWIAGRSDVLATVLGLGSVYCVLRWRDDGNVIALLAAPALFLLALLAKEVALALLLVVPIVLVLAPRTVGGPHPRRDAVTLTVLFALAVTGYFLLRRAGSITLDVTPVLGWPEVVTKPTRGVAYYVAKTLLPWPQSAFVLWDHVPRGTTAVAIVAAAALALAGAGARWWRRGDGSMLAGLLWFAAALGPSLLTTLTAGTGAPVAERYLYLPSVGAAIAAGGAFAALRSTRYRVAVTAVAVVATMVLVPLTFARNLVWRDDLALWTDTTARSRGNALPWAKLAQALAAAGEEERALALLADARQLQPGFQTRAVLAVSAGLIHLTRREYRAAESQFTAAAAADPDNAMAYLGLGQARFSIAMLSFTRPESRELLGRELLAAAGYMEQALALQPVFTEARIGLAQIRIRQGDLARAAGRGPEAEALYDAARSELEAAARSDPGATGRRDFREIAGRLPDPR